MLRFRIIPTLLLKNNGLVKTTCFKNPVYVGDPINAVKIFNDKEVDELIILDITATLEHKDLNYKRIEEIVSEAFMPIGYGGGINSIRQIENLFKIGIEKVIINTAAHINPELIKTAADIFGSQSIVVAIDVKKDLFGNYKICTHAGSKRPNTNLLTAIKLYQDLGAGELFINSIDRDGTMKGYDLNLVKQVSQNLSIPVIASGGAGALKDFIQAINTGASAVAAGAMFVFHGVHRAVLINYPKESDIEKIVEQ